MKQKGMFHALRNIPFCYSNSPKLKLFFRFHHHFDNITLICYFFQC